MCVCLCVCTCMCVCMYVSAAGTNSSTLSHGPMCVCLPGTSSTRTATSACRLYATRAWRSARPRPRKGPAAWPSPAESQAGRARRSASSPHQCPPPSFRPRHHPPLPKELLPVVVVLVEVEIQETRQRGSPRRRRRAGRCGGSRGARAQRTLGT